MNDTAPESGLPTLPPSEPGTELMELRRNLAPALRIMLDERLFEQVKRLAGIMSRDAIFTPRHLVGKAEACFTVITQAVNWNLDPQFVARCTYQTPGGSIGFEGKLVQAVLDQSGRFVGGPKVRYIGDWSKVIGKFVKATSQKGNEYVKPAWTEKDADGLGIIVSWQVRGEAEPRFWPGEDEPFFLTQCYPLNSPLWATDARTQIRYLAMRRFADGAAPGILGGMAFDFDDLMGASERLKDVTPEPPPRPRREDFTTSEAQVEPTQEETYPFEIYDVTGVAVEKMDLDAAIGAYRAFLLEGERQQGEAGLTVVWDNNQGFMGQLDERGHDALSKELSLEYGKAREAASLREAAERQQAKAFNTEPQRQQDLDNPTEATTRRQPQPGVGIGGDLPVGGIPRGNEQASPGETTTLAAERPEEGSLARPSQADPSPSPTPAGTAGAETGDLLGGKPAGTKGNAKAAAPKPDAHGRTDPFWHHPQGLRRLPVDHAAFMRELPMRLAECADWSETDDIERQNGAVIRQLNAQQRTEVSRMLAERREQLRGA